MCVLKYNPQADAELIRLYESVGAITAAHKFAVLKLALGHDGGNFYATGAEGVTDEMKQGCLEHEYLDHKGLIELSYH